RCFLGNAKVHYFGSVLCNKNVRWLYIAMNDPSLMRRVQCIGDLYRQLKEPLRRQGAFIRNILQSLPLQKLHGNEGMALILIDAINGANMRMIQGRGSLGLALEPGERS